MKSRPAPWSGIRKTKTCVVLTAGQWATAFNSVAPSFGVDYNISLPFRGVARGYY